MEGGSGAGVLVSVEDEQPASAMKARARAKVSGRRMGDLLDRPLSVTSPRGVYARGPAVFGGGQPPRKPSIASAIRSPVLPSQPSGIAPRLPRPARISSTSRAIRAGSRPVMVLVPAVTVM